MAHDLSLHSGERQTATCYDQIRADHRARYEWADARLHPSGFGVDVFCGAGYGANLLASNGRLVLAIDGSRDAIAHAYEHFPNRRAIYAVRYWPFTLPRASDFVVCLESIEHVADGAAFFAALVGALKPGGEIVFSVPNADLLDASVFSFHHRHFSLSQAQALAGSHGLTLLDWAGQDVYRVSGRAPVGELAPSLMGLRPQHAGQFLIFHSRKP